MLEITIMFSIGSLFIFLFESRVLFSILSLEFMLFMASLSILSSGLSYTPIVMMMVSAGVLCAVLSFICLSLRSFSSNMTVL